MNLNLDLFDIPENTDIQGLPDGGQDSKIDQRQPIGEAYKIYNNELLLKKKTRE